jgi:mono/diheme cytochrome c family protein
MPLRSIALARLAKTASAHIAGAVVMTVLLWSPAQAQDPSAQRGVVIARTYCVGCHSIDKVSPSPLKEAPPFRDLHKKYPVENLQESLAEGIVTGHPSMPQFRFDTGQTADFIAFLNSLR